MPRVLGKNVIRDREKGTIPIDQKDYTDDVVQRFGVKDRNPPSHQERDRTLRATNRR